MERSEGIGTGTVDQEAETVESTDEANTVPQEEPTVSRPHLLSLRYESNTPTQLSDKFPTERVRKTVPQTIVMGRGQNLDVLLNDEHMPRKFVELWCSVANDGTPKWYIKNLSSKKAVRMTKNGTRTTVRSTGDNFEEIQNDCQLKLEVLQFTVQIEDGDLGDNTEFEIEFLPMDRATDLFGRQNSSSTNSSNSLTSAAELARQRADSSSGCAQCGLQSAVGACFAGPFYPVGIPIGQHLPPSAATISTMPVPQVPTGHPCQHHHPQCCSHCQTVQAGHVQPGPLNSGSQTHQPSASEIPRYYWPQNAGASYHPEMAQGLPMAGNQPALPQSHPTPFPSTFIRPPDISAMSPRVPGAQQLAGGAPPMNGLPYPSASHQQNSDVYGIRGFSQESLYNYMYQQPFGNQQDQRQDGIYHYYGNESGERHQSEMTPGRLHGPSSMPVQGNQYGPFLHQHPGAYDQTSRPPPFVAQPESAAVLTIPTCMSQTQHTQPPHATIDVHPIRYYSPADGLPAAPPVTHFESLKLGRPVQVTAQLPTEVVTASPVNSLVHSGSGSRDSENDGQYGPQSSSFVQSVGPQQAEVSQRANEGVTREATSRDVGGAGGAGIVGNIGNAVPRSTENNGSPRSFSSGHLQTASAPPQLQQVLGSGGFPDVTDAVVFSSLTNAAPNGNRLILRTQDIMVNAAEPPSADFNSLSSYRVHDLQGNGNSQQGSSGSRRQPQEDDERRPQEHDDEQNDQ